MFLFRLYSNIETFKHSTLIINKMQSYALLLLLQEIKTKKKKIWITIIAIVCKFFFSFFFKFRLLTKRDKQLKLNFVQSTDLKCDMNVTAKSKLNKYWMEIELIFLFFFYCKINNCLDPRGWLVLWTLKSSSIYSFGLHSINKIRSHFAPKSHRK